VLRSDANANMVKLQECHSGALGSRLSHGSREKKKKKKDHSEDIDVDDDDRLAIAGISKGVHRDRAFPDKWPEWTHRWTKRSAIREMLRVWQ
jgi:hypothetical protein